jgi:hypothetical protein
MKDGSTKERPIIFSSAMVRAILDGRKTQTRRIIKPQPPANLTNCADDWNSGFVDVKCPHGAPGDRLWVRESWSGEHWISDIRPKERFGFAREGCLAPFPPATWYWADGEPGQGDWERPRASIQMPRWASRITLEITSIRVERLHDISEEDAIAEGMPSRRDDGAWLCPVEKFGDLWEEIHGRESWNKSPWVWVIEFRRLGAES